MYVYIIAICITVKHHKISLILHKVKVKPSLSETIKDILWVQEVEFNCLLLNMLLKLPLMFKGLAYSWHDWKQYVCVKYTILLFITSLALCNSLFLSNLSLMWCTPVRCKDNFFKPFFLHPGYGQSITFWYEPCSVSGNKDIMVYEITACMHLCLQWSYS